MHTVELKICDTYHLPKQEKSETNLEYFKTRPTDKEVVLLLGQLAGCILRPTLPRVLVPCLVSETVVLSWTHVDMSTLCGPNTPQLGIYDLDNCPHNQTNFYLIFIGSSGGYVLYV